MREITSKARLEQYIARYNLGEVFPPEVRGSLRLLSYQKGESITKPGARPDSLNIIMEGSAKVCPSNEDGRSIVLNFLYPQDLSGEIEYFADCEYLHSVYALGGVVILSMPRHLLQSHLMSYVPFLQYICRCLNNKLIDHSRTFSNAKLYGARSRFCRYLLDQSARLCGDAVPYSATEAALYLGVTDRHLRRIIQTYVQQDVIKKERKTIEILRRDVLKRDSVL